MGKKNKVKLGNAHSYLNHQMVEQPLAAADWPCCQRPVANAIHTSSGSTLQFLFLKCRLCGVSQMCSLHTNVVVGTAQC